MSGNIMDTMKKEKKKSFNEGQRVVSNQTEKQNSTWKPTVVSGVVNKMNNVTNKMDSNSFAKLAGEVDAMRKGITNTANANKAATPIATPNTAVNTANGVVQSKSAFDNQWQKQFDYARESDKNDNFAKLAGEVGALQKATANVPISNVVSAPQGYNPNADYAQMIKDAMSKGASADEVQKLSDMRNYKIDSNGQYGNYKNDEIAVNAQNYINMMKAAPQGYNPNTDYASELAYAIASGATGDQVQDLLNKRNYKISLNPDYDKYRNDNVSLEAQKYINNYLDIDKLYGTDAYNEAVEKKLLSEIDNYNRQKELADKEYDNLRSEAYKNARLSAIGNNEALASIGLAGGLYDSPVSGYSETSRIADNNNLRGNIAAISLQEQQRLNEIEKLISQARNEAEYNKLSYLAQQNDRIADAKINQHNTDRAFDYTKYRDEVADSQWNQQFGFNAEQAKIQNDQWDKQQKLAEDQFEFTKEQTDIENALERDKFNRDVFTGDRDYNYAVDQDKKDRAFAEKQLANDTAISYAKINADKEQNKASNWLDIKKIEAEGYDPWAGYTVDEIIENKDLITKNTSEEYYNNLLVRKQAEG